MEQPTIYEKALAERAPAKGTIAAASPNARTLTRRWEHRCSQEDRSKIERLERKVRDAHREAQEFAADSIKSATNAVGRALLCGGYLLELKELLGHGNFMGYVKARFKFSHVTANRWMRVAEELKKQGDSNSSALNNLSEAESVTALFKKLGLPAQWQRNRKKPEQDEAREAGTEKRADAIEVAATVTPGPARNEGLERLREAWAHADEDARREFRAEILTPETPASPAPASFAE